MRGEGGYNTIQQELSQEGHIGQHERSVTMTTLLADL